MTRNSDFWQFISERLRRGERVELLVVADSSGSSPGRAGYKMAVGADGELCGSIGGGVMEVSLVEEAKELLSEGHKRIAFVREQVHRKDVPDSSGMICSGRQTVIFKTLGIEDVAAVEQINEHLARQEPIELEISNLKFAIIEGPGDKTTTFTRSGESEFVYRERLDCKHDLFIIGGGHCALALSELMSKLGFRIAIFDDRPSLNTLDKNEFADEVTIVDGYDRIADHVPSHPDVYVVVMTLGYASDALVIRQLIDHDVKYLGVLGSRAKMATLMKELRDDGLAPERLERIHTPIGIPINSRTPEEIAVSIAAEIISVRNA